MFESLFGVEGSLIVRFVVAFVIVLALIGLTFWLIRRFGGARVGTAAQRGRQPRLAVVDAAPVDGRRRLVLIRRDNVEHLVMIGGPSDVVIEQNILRAVPVTPPREVPVPRTPGAIEAASAAPRAQQEEAGWTPPELPVARPQPELPRPTFPRPESLPRPRSMDALARSGLTSRVPAPTPEPPPIVPAPEPTLDPDLPRTPASGDAALASMAQRLEAALRRPSPNDTPGDAVKLTPPERPAAAPAETPAGDQTAAAASGPRADPKGAKSKSVLDSLEEEMASLLGRPPGKE